MKLFYFSRDNLNNSSFIKEFVSAYEQVKDKVILLHEPFGNLEDTRFVTKRISALLSEMMVFNNGYSGDQRKIVSLVDGEVQVNMEIVRSQLHIVNLVVLNSIAASDGGPEFADALAVAKLIQSEMPIEETVLFSRNGRSPLTREKQFIEDVEDIQPLLNVYEEERAALENALDLAPASIISPSKLGQ